MADAELVDQVRADWDSTYEELSVARRSGTALRAVPAAATPHR
jgi:hypothetical protein